ncbi:hypothetical protein K458DRAFT_416439 [Lentithecium fluviatile CBS 122367]|uniref:Mediator complex subunit 15 KIX domain-containing protein n=1 Tax=Lentithecium fluviatile CBS 122367 TaxID=1168545 RepID=A0A6G1J7A9_9PLEO|nr:hypothetical protein K458DRAFT_416439 [Lentithecium fluviatile CBS 122367]
MNNPNFPNMMAAANAANRGGNIQQSLVRHYRNQQQKAPPGWQQTVSAEERGTLALQCFTSSRLLKPDQSEGDALRMAIQLETHAFTTANSKDQYSTVLRQKLFAMQTLRQQQMQGMAPNQNNPMNAMNAAQMGMMGQANPQGPRPNAPQQMPQGFPNPQLQRPMQASPIPMTQGQSSFGINGANGGAPQGQNVQQPNVQQGQQPRQENIIINRLAQKLMESARDDIRNQYRIEVENWPDERRQQLLQRGVDPIFLKFRQQAEAMLRSGKLNPQQLAALQQGQTQMAQHQGQLNQAQNQQMNMNQRQSQEFDFTALANQQNEAMRVQDQGQQVVPASNNPLAAQMANFAQQNPQAGQVPNAAMAQRQQAAQNALQQNANLQRQAAQAQAQARIQQMQQQQQQQQQQGQRNSGMLTGQLGLNLPPGTQPQQSPAMPMLNRPMIPPGQPGPTTPQQRPQAHVPQMTPQNQDQGQLQQLMREAKQRATSIAGAQNQPLTEQARLGLLPNEMDPMVKQQLLKVPEAQFRTILNNYMTGLRRNNAMQNGAFPGGQATPGQPNMMVNSAQALQIGGMPNAMMNSANIGNMHPGMNLGQQTPGMGGQQFQMGQRPGAPQQPQQRLVQAQQLLQANPGIISMTDNKPFPITVLNTSIRQSLPQDVKTWAQLKQWAGQNPGLLPGVDNQKLLLLQVLHFTDLMRQSQGAMAGLRPPQPNNMAGIAPPAQMTPGAMPNRPPQQPPNMMNLGPIQVTPQEIQAFRQRLPQNQVNTPDDQLRTFIYQQKLQHRRQQQQQQQQQQALNLQAQQRGQAQAQQLQNPMAGQPQAPRPPSAQPQPTQPAPQPKPAAPPQQPAQAPQPAPPTNVSRNLKRPNEDSAEGNKEGPSSNVAPQAPAMIPSKSQQGLNMTPQQQSQMRANLMKAQDASSNKAPPRLPSQEELAAKMRDPALEQRYKAMINEENRKLPHGQVVQVAPEVRAQLQQQISKHLQNIKKVEQALRLFLVQYEGAEPESVVRTVIRARILLLRQMNPADGTLKPELTLSEIDFKKCVGQVLSFVQKVMTRIQAQNNTAAQNAQQPQASQAPNQNARPAQLNAANLKLLDQLPRQPKAPPAPTATQPPFSFGNAASPRGVPTYLEGAKPLQNLAIPDKKRQKLDPSSQTSTPGPKQSPRVGKGSSPELKRQQPPEKPAVQRPTFKCEEKDCEYAVRGFDTPAELKAHVSHAHVKVDDPFAYALQSMADHLDVDAKTGQPKQDPAAAIRGAKPATTASRAALQPTKPGQTPSMPPTAATPVGAQAAATPMTRVPTQPGIKSSPSTSLLRTPQTTNKVATPSTGVPARATPASVANIKPAPKEPEAPAVAEAEEDPQQLLPMNLFDFSYEEIYSTLDANGTFTTLDLKDEDNSWALRSRPSSPLDTPDSSAKDTPSTRQSDISENDNLLINIDIKDMDMPDAWMAALQGEPLPLDAQLSEDLQNLGVTLPPMDNDDMMLFYPNSGMMDLDTLDRTMDTLGGGTLDPSVLGMS